MATSANAGELSGRRRWEGANIAQPVLRCVRLGHPAVNEVTQNVGHVSWQRRLVVSPTPDGHATDVKETSGRAITAKGNLEQKIMLSAGKSAFEAR